MPRSLRWPHPVVVFRASRPRPYWAELQTTFVFRAISMLLLGGSIALSGCSAKSADGRKAVFPTRGKLLVDGQAPRGALLVLHPANPSLNDVHPFAHVDPDGSFALSTYRGRDGAPAGDYIATIEWRVPQFPGADGPWPNALPERYARAATSDLRVHVAAEPNELPLIVLRR